MFVKQISVFIENKNGKLAEFTRTLAEAKIDMAALSVADTSDFGILRAIVNDTNRAVSVLRDAGYTVTLTDVIAVAVPDRPGGLAEVVAIMDKHNISIEYMYSFVRNVAGTALIVFRVDKPVDTSKLLIECGLKVLDQEQVF